MKGWLTTKQSDLLYKTAVECGGNILELGSLVGKSSVILAQAAAINGKIVMCADLFPYNLEYFNAEDKEHLIIGDTLKEFRDNTKDYKNIYTLKIDHGDLRDILVGRFGMVYVDGDHSFARVLADICYGGYVSDVIAVHDYGNPDTPDVQLCVDFMVNKWKAEVIIEEGLIVIKKYNLRSQS